MLIRFINQWNNFTQKIRWNKKCRDSANLIKALRGSK